MAITLTRNLKLKIDSSYDEVSRYNLNKIDTLASIFQINTNGQAIIRSAQGISFEPNSPDLGGSGVGGDVSLGSADQPLASLTINSDSFSLSSGGLTLADSASGGTKNLLFKYKTDLDGAVDTAADRTLLLDLNGADRQLILGGNLKINTGLDINLSSLTNGQVLTYNSSTSQWENEDPTAASSSDLVATWAPADTAIKSVLHGFGTRNLLIQVVDENFQITEIDKIEYITANTVTLTSSQVPPGNWTILIKKVG